MIGKIQPLLEVHYRSPSGRFEGWLAIDSLVEGASIGGTRMTPTVSAKEVLRLARGMTMKSRALDLKTGGAKVGIRYDPFAADKQAVLEEFFKHVQPICERMYGFGPDMYTNCKELDAVTKSIGARHRLWAVANQAGDGAGALERYSASVSQAFGPFNSGDARTGAGVARSIERLRERLGLPKSVRVAIQGFGCVGSVAAWCLERAGHRVVAVSDAGGSYSSADGLKVDAMLAAVGTGPVIDRRKLPPDVKAGPADELFGASCDVLVLAATPDCITPENVGQVKARVLLEGGNIAVTRSAELMLHARGVPVVPDFVASAGAVCGSDSVMRNLCTTKAEGMIDFVSNRVADATIRSMDLGEKYRLPIRDALWLERVAKPA